MSEGLWVRSIVFLFALIEDVFVLFNTVQGGEPGCCLSVLCSQRSRTVADQTRCAIQQVSMWRPTGTQSFL